MARVKKEVTFEIKLVVDGTTYLLLKDVARDLGFKTQKTFIAEYGDMVMALAGAGKWVSVDDYNALKGADIEEVTPDTASTEVTEKDIDVIVDEVTEENNTYAMEYTIKICGKSYIYFLDDELDSLRPHKIGNLAIKNFKNETGRAISRKVQLHIYDLLWDMLQFNEQGGSNVKREIERLRTTNKALEQQLIMERYNRIMDGGKGSYSTNGKLSKVSNKSQYRVLAKVCHPDNAHDDGKAFKVLEEIFQ